MEDVPNQFPEELLKSLLGHPYDFYGVDNHAFCIGSGSGRMALEAVEDPHDGYRSYFGCFTTAQVGKVFFGASIARVLFEEAKISEEAFEGWCLVDVDTGHVWLKVGTGNTNDYYPYFVFEYRPDPSKTVQSLN